MVICSCRQIRELELRKKLSENPNISSHEIKKCPEEGCCSMSRACNTEIDKIFAEHAGKLERL